MASRWPPLSAGGVPTALDRPYEKFVVFIAQESARKCISDVQPASVLTSGRVSSAWHSNSCKVYPFCILFNSKLPHVCCTRSSHYFGALHRAATRHTFCIVMHVLHALQHAPLCIVVHISHASSLHFHSMHCHAFWNTCVVAQLSPSTFRVACVSPLASHCLVHFKPRAVLRIALFCAFQTIALFCAFQTIALFCAFQIIALFCAFQIVSLI